MIRKSQEERREALRRKQRNDINNNGFSKDDGIIDASAYDDVNFFSAKQGKELPKMKGTFSLSFDILPYIISTDKHPSKDLGIGFEDYVLEYWTHGNIGPENKVVLCLKRTYGKPCPICEEQAAMKKQGISKDDPDYKKLNASQRCVFNIIDKFNPEKGVQLFKVSGFLFFQKLKEKIQKEEAKGEEEITFSDLDCGCTINCDATETTKGDFTFMDFSDFSFSERKKPYSESILDEVFPLDAMIKVPTYDEVKRVFLSLDGPEDTKKEEAESKPRGRKPKNAEKEKVIDTDSDSEQQINDDDENGDPEELNEEVSDEENNKELNENNENEGNNNDPPFTLKECSEGYTFGKDYDQHPECSECNETRWNNCADECDSLKKEEEEAAKKKEEVKTRSRRKK
jgi:hypothetical protein